MNIDPSSALAGDPEVLARLLHPDQPLEPLLHGGAQDRGRRPGTENVAAAVGLAVAAELTRIGLRALAPSLVIIQAGHDDIGVPVRAEEQRVRQSIALIRAQAPHARIALITVFTTRHSRLARPYAAAAAYRADHAIVAAATAADHNVIIMDPLAARWAFARSHDGLHPSADGSQWIARTVAGVLRSHGIAAATGSAAAGTPRVCDSGIHSERLRAGHSSRPRPVPALEAGRAR